MQRWDIGTTPEGNKVMYKEEHGRFILYADHRSVEDELALTKKMLTMKQDDWLAALKECEAVEEERCRLRDENQTTVFRMKSVYDEDLKKFKAQMSKENTILRGLVAKYKPECIYCGETITAKCCYGFPGCSKMDDIMTAECLADAEAQKRIATLTAELEGWKQQHETDLANNQKICATVDELSGRIDKAKSILTMGGTVREREAYQVLSAGGKEAK